jgi:hypothetical protein
VPTIWRGSRPPSRRARSLSISKRERAFRSHGFPRMLTSGGRLTVRRADGKPVSVARIAIEPVRYSAERAPPASRRFAAELCSAGGAILRSLVPGFNPTTQESATRQEGDHPLVGGGISGPQFSRAARGRRFVPRWPTLAGWHPPTYAFKGGASRRHLPLDRSVPSMGSSPWV